jgi:hypothetical protein
MAFEVPLEADRVDDLNFFTTLVRAPLLGTLIWIFGDKDSQNEEKSVESLSIGDSSTDTNNSSFNKTTSMKRSHSKTINLKKTPPSLTGSELSDFGEIRESFEGICLDSTISGKIKKEISWSDELGLGDIRQEFNHKVRNHVCAWDCRLIVTNICEMHWGLGVVGRRDHSFLSRRSSSLRLLFSLALPFFDLWFCLMIESRWISHGQQSMENRAHASVLRSAIIGLVRHSDDDYRD